MDYKQLYAKAIKYLMSRDYIVTSNISSPGAMAYPKDSNLCTLAVYYFEGYRSEEVLVWKTDAYPEDCHDVEALMLMGCRSAENTLKSTVVKMKPAESYIPTWVRDLF